MSKHRRQRGDLQSPLECPVCGGGHAIHRCPDFENLGVDARWDLAKKKTLCFTCLATLRSHKGSKCIAKGCGKPDCKKTKRRHHAMLHRDFPQRSRRNSRRANSAGSGRSNRSNRSTRSGRSNQQISSVNMVNCTRAYLKIVPVVLTGPSAKETVYALLDEGSTITLLEENVMRRLGATGQRVDLQIEGIAGKKVSESGSRRCTIDAKGVHSRTSHKLEVHTVKKLRLSAQTVDKRLVDKCEHLRDIARQLTYSGKVPTMLIGQDNWDLIVTRQLKTGRRGLPVASFTSFGWVLHGSAAESGRPVNFVHQVRYVNSDLDAMVRGHFAIESLGVEAKQPRQDIERQAVTMLDRTSKRLVDGRFETGLLWKQGVESLPRSYEMAKRRLVNIEKRLAKDQHLKTEYCKQINNLLSNGYAERAPAKTSKRVWYLPHFAVVHPQKNKMRLVFDAAAKVEGASLNDRLMTGPDLLQSLFGVLTRFREGTVAVVADIKEMFLQVRIAQEDRDSIRFLWRDDCRKPPTEYRMTSLIFGAASSPCTAIYIKNRNAREVVSGVPEAADAIVKNHYMDDYLKGFYTVDRAIAVSKEVSRIHSKACFELRGWASNVAAVTQDMSNKHAQGSVQLGGPSDYEKTLGLHWDVSQDTLGFNLNLRTTPDEILDGTQAPTKRQVTSTLMSVFDPLGLASPVLVQGKVLLQEIWRSRIEWDEALRQPEWRAWLKWVERLKQLTHLRIPRSISNKFEKSALHVFVDASERAYAACIYLLQRSGDEVRVSLVAGKSRVAPLKPTSIPRLELQAALLGARLASSIRAELDLPIEKSTYWSDSRTVLAWIQSDPRSFKPFVAHRLAEIEETTKPIEWRWVPTKLNVADDATRDAPENFSYSHRWFHGPEFLKQNEQHWPVVTKLPRAAADGDSEVKRSGDSVNHVRETQKDSSLPDYKRFSKWIRFVRASARVLQAVEIFKGLLSAKVHVVKRDDDPTWKPQSRKAPKRSRLVVRGGSAPIKFRTLDVSFIQKAEELIFCNVQSLEFGAEIQCLKKGQPLPHSCRVKGLNLRLDECGLLRVSGRLGKARFVEIVRDPVVLCAKNPVIRMLIQHYHERFNHGNHATVINELRQSYYITSLRTTVRSIVRECVLCRLKRGAVSLPPQGDLPAERLAAQEPPFSCTGVDYFGPMTVTIGRRHEKRWGALFTCLTTRAVHMELAASLSTDSMLSALRRMCARRGTPRVLFSDNGTNFVGANRELKKEWAEIQSQLAEKVSTRGIVWKFIPPGAPSHGGAWERIVRSIKVALSATLHERFPRVETLHTLLLEAEHTVNSRPLTNVSTEPNELEALTPNHILLGRSNGMFPVCESENKATAASSWRLAQAYADLFWKRWLKEYLPSLLPRRENSRVHRPLEVGDIVIVVDSSLPRNTWPRGVVESVIVGPDGKIRMADVKTRGGTLRRPLSRLVHLTTSNES